jgi:hypothetical protein
VLIGRSGGPLGNAYIIPLDPQIDSNGHHYIPIYYHFPFGTGHSVGEDSALVRPFKKLMQEEKPAGKTAFVFYRQDNISFVLGSFTFTGRRIIFFPPSTLTRVVYTPNGKGLTSERYNIEHFTLEEDFTNWHITLYQKLTENIRYPTIRTTMVSHDVFLWFIMAIPHPTRLEPMPKTQQYLLKAPNVIDLQRRKQIMLQSVEGNIFPVTELSVSPPTPYFINFEFFIGKEKNELDLPEIPYAKPSPTYNDLKKRIRSKSFDFNLSNAVSLSIRVSEIQRIIQNDMGFIWWPE